MWVSLPLICLLRTDISSKFIHTLHFDDGGNIFNITSRTISRGFCISFLAFQFGDLRFNMLISFRLQSHTPHYAIRERTNRNKTCKQNTETLKNDVTEPAELHKQKTHTREISRRAHSGAVGAWKTDAFTHHLLRELHFTLARATAITLVAIPGTRYRATCVTGARLPNGLVRLV